MRQQELTYPPTSPKLNSSNCQLDNSIWSQFLQPSPSSTINILGVSLIKNLNWKLHLFPLAKSTSSRLFCNVSTNFFRSFQMLSIYKSLIFILCHTVPSLDIYFFLFLWLHAFNPPEHEFLLTYPYAIQNHYARVSQHLDPFIPFTGKFWRSFSFSYLLFFFKNGISRHLPIQIWPLLATLVYIHRNNTS